MRRRQQGQPSAIVRRRPSGRTPTGPRPRPRGLPRPRRQGGPGWFAALTVAASVALLILAVSVALASLPGSGLIEGTAGPELARLLALAAGAAGLFGLTTGMLLAGDSPDLRRLLPAVLVGIVVGGAQATMLLIPVTGLISLTPWLLLPLALPAIPRSLGLSR